MVFRYPHLWPSVFTLLECIFKANTSMFLRTWTWNHHKTWLEMMPNDWPFLGGLRFLGLHPCVHQAWAWCILFNRNLSFLVVPRWFKDNMLMVLITFTSAKQTNDTLEEFWQRYIHIVVLDANVTVTVTVNAINHWAFGHVWEKGFWDLLGLSLLTKNQCRINRNV